MSTTQYLLTNRVSGREKLYRAGSGRAAARGMHALPGPCRGTWLLASSHARWPDGAATHIHTYVAYQLVIQLFSTLVTG